MTSNPAIAHVLEELDRQLESLPSGLEFRRTFIATYRRTTEAVGHSIVQHLLLGMNAHINFDLPQLCWP